MAEITLGWDIGGAHLKACLRVGGAVADVAQWPCPLWQGLAHLESALDAACARWPSLVRARHALTMTGEMTDLFADREDGVAGIAALIAQRWPDARCFAGDAGWVPLVAARAHWPHIASANWLATARHAARVLGTGVVIDIGSTTTDLVAFRDGEVLTRARSDFDRLASGELVYHGVVRTPLCAFAPRVTWRGATINVMHEFFATAADIHRLTGELDTAHDQQPSADGAGKDREATRRRLARMVGLDARDATDEDWLELARAWRAAQVAELGTQLARVLARHALDADVPTIAAGCGAFLVPDLRAAAGHPGRMLDYARDVAEVTAAHADWARVCAPCVAVAALHDAECAA